MLQNDFTDPRWRTAAKKNAYALLGLRRFEYAAAFFLLADAPSDALSVLASPSQVGDLQLAIAVGRVYCGDDSKVFRELLRKYVLPAAARKGDRWMTSCAFWMLEDVGSKHKALEALLEPVEPLVEVEDGMEEGAKSWRNDEPGLVWYYDMLREKIRRTPGEKVRLLSPRQEHDLVMRCAIMYSRSGLDRLALRLVRDWRYSEPLTWPRAGTVAADGMKAQESTINDGEGGDASESDEEAEAGDEVTGKDEKQKPQEATEPPPAETAPQRKKVTEEPSAASILDNFNF